MRIRRITTLRHRMNPMAAVPLARPQPWRHWLAALPWVLLAAAGIALAPSARADWRSSPMRFFVVPNTAFSLPPGLASLTGVAPAAPQPHQLSELTKILLHGSTAVKTTLAWGLIATGVIGARTPDDFRRVMSDPHLLAGRGTRVFFLSPGGNLIAGLELGREIRKAGFTTVVGLPRGGKAFAPIERSVCASACTFAFLGGISRTVAPGSIYAVHRFFRGNYKPGRNVLTDPTRITRIDQQLAGDLVAYIRAMGVSADLYKISTEGSRDKTVNLTPAQMAALRVTTHREITANMLYEPDGHAVMVVRDSNGGMNHGRMELYCSIHHRLYDRAYFATDPVATSPPIISQVVLSIFPAQGAPPVHVTVPSNDYAVAPVSGSVMPIDVYIPPGMLFHALQSATAVQVRIRGAGLLGGSAVDRVGNVAVPIPLGVRARLAAIGRGC